MEGEAVGGAEVGDAGGGVIGGEGRKGVVVEAEVGGGDGDEDDVDAAGVAGGEGGDFVEGGGIDGVVEHEAAHVFVFFGRDDAGEGGL